jgi:hypothetical protein
MTRSISNIVVNHYEAGRHVWSASTFRNWFVTEEHIVCAAVARRKGGVIHRRLSRFRIVGAHYYQMRTKESFAEEGHNC